jgi:protein-disulfide isomerase
MLTPSITPQYDHISGDVFAPVVVVEYGDLLCPHCGGCYAEIKALQDVLGNHLLFAFRHYFAFNPHSVSMEAAVTSEVAGLQGKFWYMHDIIFENQRYLSRSTLSRFGNDVGVDMSPFKDTRTCKILAQRVIRDFESGIKSGVDGTPPFLSIAGTTAGTTGKVS